MESYDLAIIGTGSGNSILDERYAGKRVAICEQGTFGGAGQLHGRTGNAHLHRPEQPVPHVVHCRSHPRVNLHRAWRMVR